ncbi:MAG: hypothetical protein Q9210_003067, partial [Variospora velana]
EITVAPPAPLVAVSSPTSATSPEKKAATSNPAPPDPGAAPPNLAQITSSVDSSTATAVDFSNEAQWTDAMNTRRANLNADTWVDYFQCVPPAGGPSFKFYSKRKL